MFLNIFERQKLVDTINHARNSYNRLLAKYNAVVLLSERQANEITNLNAALVRKNYSNARLKEFLTEERDTNKRLWTTIDDQNTKEFKATNSVKKTKKTSKRA